MHFGLLISICLIIYSVMNNIFIGYALIAFLILFTLIALRKGYSLDEIVKMSYNGGKKSFVIIKMLTLVGAIIGIWMASGTIPAIIYYCLYYINPNTYILSVFIICCIASFLLGTAIGTVSTVGIPLIIIASNGNISLNMVAGAIIAGAYFGDRCSPMSSSAALVSNLTDTDIYANIKNMLYSSIVPFLISLAFYYMLSVAHPLKVMNNNLSFQLFSTFNIQFILLLPALIILVFSLFRVKIEISILASIICAFVLCIVFQNYDFKHVINFIIFGFKMSSSNILASIIKGGGIISMFKASLVVFLSCCLAGIFQGIKAFDLLKDRFTKIHWSRVKLFTATSVLSIITAAFGCTQSIAVIMTNEILNECYEDNSIEKHGFALDLENSGILFSALIPWNSAAFIPTTTMKVSIAGYVPYAFYLYILPIIYLISHKLSDKHVEQRYAIQK